MSGAVEDENDDATRSEEAKKRGTSSFMKKTTEGYKEALAAYTEAVELVRPPHLWSSAILMLSPPQTAPSCQRAELTAGPKPALCFESAMALSFLCDSWLYLCDTRAVSRPRHSRAPADQGQDPLPGRGGDQDRV